jgi:hypothetical protein
MQHWIYWHMSVIVDEKVAWLDRVFLAWLDSFPDPQFTQAIGEKAKAERKKVIIMVHLPCLTTCMQTYIFCRNSTPPFGG